VQRPCGAVSNILVKCTAHSPRPTYSLKYAYLSSPYERQN